MGRVISTAIQFVDGFTRPSREVIQGMQRMGREAIKVGKQIQNAGKTISNAGSSLTKSVTLPIAGVATAAVKTAADFESAMSEVGAISGASAKDMEVLSAKAKEMGATTSFSASESAEAMKYMAMAGWKTADMTKGIAGIMNLAAASGEDLAATSDIVTDGLTAFGMSAKESGRFADVLAATSSNANTNVALMGETFKYCASTAGAMGYSIEDVSVAIGIMGNAQIKGSMAGTTLKNVIANLAKPTDAQAKVMEKLGISLTDSSGNMKSFAEVIGNLRSSFSGLSKTEKAAAATTLAGKQSMAGLLTLVNASQEDFDKLTAAINGSSGAAETMAQKMLDNLNGQLTLLKSAIEGIAITLGNRLMPYVEKAVSWVQKIADYLNGLSDAQIDNIIKWAGIAAAIGPAIMAFGKIVSAVGTAKLMFGKITKIIGDFGGIMGVITSPAGIVIGALIAIAVAAALIIKNWEKVKGFLQSVGEWFKSAFEKAGFSAEGFISKFSSIGNTIGSIAGTIGRFCKSIAKIFEKEFAGSISEGATEAGNMLEILVGGVAVAFDGIAGAVDKGLKVFDALLKFFTGAFSGNWKSAAQGFRNSLKNIFPPDIANGLIKAFDKTLPFIKAVVSGIKRAFAGLVQDVKKIFGSITNVFKGIGTMLKGIFSGDAETALKGFQTAAGGIIDAIGGIFKTKINAIKNFVVGAFSKFLPKGVIDKIAGAFDLVASKWELAIGAAKGCISGFVRAIKPIIENLKTVFKGVGQFIKAVFTGDFKGALNGLKTIAKGQLSSLVNLIKAPFKLIGGIVKGAINSFQKMNVVKKIFTALGKAVNKVLSACGVDMKKFSANVNNIRTRVGSIVKGMQKIFKTVFGAIGKVVKKVASVIEGVFGKKVGGTCEKTNAKIKALKIMFSAVFKGIASAVKSSVAIIATVVKVAFGVVKGTIAAVVNNITSIISGLLTVFDGIITFISGVFTGNWKQAWEGIKMIFKGVFDSLVALCKAPINAVIGIINGAISGLNGIKVSIPDWVPGLGGKSFGINIPKIPMLYKGTDSWKGGAAIIHDRGGEIVDLPKGSRVYPHDKSIEMARKEGAASSSAGSININIHKLADKLEVRSDEDIDRIAEALAYRLKKVAFNTGMA